jgi:hypothetical protein
MFVSAATVEIFYLDMHVEFLDYVRRSVYLLNICYIRVFYRFNRNMALHFSSSAWFKLLLMICLCFHVHERCLTSVPW